MRTLPVILLQCLAILTSATTQNGYIYTHDIRPRTSSQLSTISPETAYSIWTRRLGLSERRRLSSVEASVLEEIDLFGGYQAALFGAVQENTRPSRLSIVVEGFDDGERPTERLKAALADTEAPDHIMAGLQQYPQLAVAEPSEELASRLKMKRLNAEGIPHSTFEWSFATEDKLKVFFELKFTVCPTRRYRTDRTR